MEDTSKHLSKNTNQNLPPYKPVEFMKHRETTKRLQNQSKLQTTKTQSATVAIGVCHKKSKQLPTERRRQLEATKHQSHWQATACSSETSQNCWMWKLSTRKNKNTTNRLPWTCFNKSTWAKDINIHHKGFNLIIFSRKTRGTKPIKRPIAQRHFHGRRGGPLQVSRSPWSFKRGFQRGV